MFSSAANEFAFKTLATSLSDSLKKIADRLGKKEEREDEEEGEEDSEDEEKEEDYDEEEEEEKKKENMKKIKTSHPDQDESAKDKQ